ncbi:MAG: peptidase inhibitor family I36 protein [Acidothermaceae bacterium]
MKTWIKSALPALSAAAALSVTSVVSLSGNAVAAQVPADGQAVQTTQSWMAASGLPQPDAAKLQAEIAAQIAAYGGVQISPYEVAYNGGDPIMVFANPITGDVPTVAGDRAEAGTGTASGAATPGVQSMVVPLTSYRYGCPYSGSTGWTCFYQNVNFNGYSCGGGGGCADGARMLEFASCGTQSLGTYGFSDQTSSWVNNTSSYVTVYNSSGGALWSESPGSASANVGSANNDKADNFWIIC